MMDQPEFWILVATLLLIGLIGKRVVNQIRRFLDDRILVIRKELDEAEQLNQEAAIILKKLKEEYKETSNRAKEMLATTKRDILELERTAKKEMDHLLKKREIMILEKINHEQNASRKRIQQEITEEVTRLVDKVLKQEPSFLKENGKIKNIINKIKPPTPLI